MKLRLECLKTEEEEEKSETNSRCEVEGGARHADFISLHSCSVIESPNFSFFFRLTHIATCRRQY